MKPKVLPWAGISLALQAVFEMKCIGRQGDSICPSATVGVDFMSIRSPGRANVLHTASWR